MGGIPVVTVGSGGLAVVDVTATTGRGLPVSVAANGRGIPVTVAAAGLPVVFVVDTPGGGGGGTGTSGPIGLLFLTMGAR